MRGLQAKALAKKQERLKLKCYQRVIAALCAALLLFAGIPAIAVTYGMNSGEEALAAEESTDLKAAKSGNILYIALPNITYAGITEDDQAKLDVAAKNPDNWVADILSTEPTGAKVTYDFSLNGKGTIMMCACSFPEGATSASLVCLFQFTDGSGQPHILKTGAFTLKPSGTSTNIPVTGVSIDAAENWMTEGEAVQINATVIPNDATNQKIEWSSSDTNVATVDGNGLVTAVGAGEATITAKALGSAEGKTVQATCDVEVSAKTPVTSITVKPEALSLTEGGTGTLTADVAPSDATTKGVTWSSDDEGVATVTADGTVTAKGEGKAVITATAKDGSGITGTCNVTVTSAATEYSVSLRPNSEGAYVGSAYELKATIDPDTYTGDIAWTSSDTAVATVSAKSSDNKTGVLDCKKAGRTTITATLADAADAPAATYEVIVVEKNPITPDPDDGQDAPSTTTITVTGTTGIRAAGNLSVAAGSTVELKCTTLTAIDASYKQLAAKVTGKLLNMFDVDLFVNNVQIHDGFGTIELTFPVSGVSNGSNVTVYHMHEGGTITPMPATVKNGTVAISVTDLSLFAIGCEASSADNTDNNGGNSENSDSTEAANPPSDQQPSNPANNDDQTDASKANAKTDTGDAMAQTGDDMLVGIVVLAVAAVCAIAVALVAHRSMVSRR